MEAKYADLPCALTIDIPFPTARLASVALQALRVDKELSSMVRRTFSTVSPNPPSAPSQPSPIAGPQDGQRGADQEEEMVLRAEYRATTNRMLRVAVNSFMDSLSLVLEVMEALDGDVLEEEQKKKKSAG